MNASNPISPKVSVGAAVGAVAPVVLAVLVSIVNWLATGDGQSWLNGLLAGTPPWLPVVVCSLVSAVSMGIAGYVKTDPLRRPVVPSDDPSHPVAPVSDDPDLSWTPGDESETVINVNAPNYVGSPNDLERVLSQEHTKELRRRIENGGI